MNHTSISAKCFALLFILALVGCSSASDNGGDGTTYPTVTSITPISGDESAFVVPIVSATFSEEMDDSTITAETFTLSDEEGESISGNVSYDAESMTATFTPNEGRATGVTYTATISNSIKNSAGIALEETYSWNFTTTGFFFIVLSDTHVRLPGNPDDQSYDNAGNIANLQAAIDGINTNYSDADFVMVTGDLVGCLFSEDPDDYLIGEDNPAERYKAMMDELEMPYYGALGNHDYQKGFDVDEGEGISTSDISAIESVWEKVLDIDPYSSFLHNGMRFIILNSNRGDSRNIVCPYSTAEAFCTGSFDDDQMDWFEDKLATETPSFLFFHHPIHSDDPNIIWTPGGENMLVSTSDRFYTIADNYTDIIKGIFVGHGHTWKEDTLEGVIPIHETGAIGDIFGDGENMNVVSVNPTSGAIEVIRNRE